MRRHARRGAAVGTALLIVIGGTAVWGVSASGEQTRLRTTEQRISVTDGPDDDQWISLDTTFVRPADDAKHPAVLLAHGFGGSKADVAGRARDLARHGYAVLSWSARGFGISGGKVALNSPDYEVKDVEQLVDWLADRPGVRLDAAGDPRVGIAGASYGGGIALLAAGHDRRIDAIAPQITWNDLSTSLFPNAVRGAQPVDGVFKRMWTGLLFGGGSGTLGAQSGPPGAPGTTTGHARRATDPCGRFRPEICAMYQKVAETGTATPKAIKLLRASSPSSVADRIRVPTLLIQGQNDSLFPLAQADANAAAIRKNGAPVSVVWTAGGHDGGPEQNGEVRDLTRRWFDHFLKPGTPPTTADGTGPGFRVSRSGGMSARRDEAVLRTAQADRYPGLAGREQQTVALRGAPQTVLNPPGGAPASISALPGIGALAGSAGGGSSDGGSSGGGAAALSGRLTLDMPGQSAAFSSAPLTDSVQVTGSPRVRIRVSGADDVTLFAKLYDVGPGGTTTLPHQLAAPIRVTDAKDGKVVDVRLPAIDHDFARGDRLRLALTTTDMAYATPDAAASYTVAAAGGGLRLPIDPELREQGRSLPLWVPIMPGVAVLLAVLLLIRRRRTSTGGAAPDSADTPLRISGLTKRYPDGHLAVDHVSLEAHRGQVVGLLGPNGAGKTTVLRMLMGLLHPDDGQIRIFGQRVTPGAPVLSRLGSFVEGPGFLGHLSGRANLDLYWRATGRPREDAHLDDALRIAALGDAVHRPVRTYSQGMRQRLAIAQAMLGRPDLLVLDEPTNGLDPPQIREMRDVLIRYAETGRTVIVSSHLLAEVEQTCTHVVVMREGIGVAAGPVTEIVGHGATLVLGTGEPERAARLLEELDGVRDVRTDGTELVVQLDGVSSSQVLAALVAAGVPVDRAMPNRRLEDAFFALLDEGGDRS